MKCPAIRPIVCMILLFAAVACSKGPASHHYNGWKQYGGGPDQSKYFAGNSITKENVSGMKVAWVYPSADSVSYMFSPIVVDTIMYVFGKNNSLIALQALTGKEIWIHANLQGMSRRGITYWESKDGKNRRILFTLGNSLQA